MKGHPSLAELVEYSLGEAEAGIEEHFFGCAQCTARLEELAALGEGIRAVFRSGALRAVVSRGFVEGLKRQGLRLREYPVAPGASVSCTIASEDDFVVSRLQAPLAGVERVDLVLLGEGSEADATLEDVPFDAAAGEVLFCPAAAALKALPAHTARMRLVAVGAGGKRTLGDYTFAHTPS